MGYCIYIQVSQQVPWDAQSHGCNVHTYVTPGGPNPRPHRTAAHCASDHSTFSRATSAEAAGGPQLPAG